MLTINLLRKRCAKCKIEKSVVLGFHRDNNPKRADGFMSWCRKCSAVARERWRVSHMDEVNADRVEYMRKLRQSVLDKFGAACGQCGFDDPRALQIDHVNNDGHRDEHKWRKDRVGHFKSVLKDVGGKYQLLCANCNVIKAYEHNRSRHFGRVA